MSLRHSLKRRVPEFLILSRLPLLPGLIESVVGNWNQLMVVKSRNCLALICVVFTLTSCGGGPRPGSNIKRAPTVKVSGEVTVDGNAAEGVMIACIPQGNYEHPEAATLLNATSDADGRFVFTTYDLNDGLPPGEYALTFIWPKPKEGPMGIAKRQTNAEKLASDQLNRKYDSAAKSPAKITVEKGNPLEMETIELTTK
jgi:hypothetical protein